MYALTSGRVLLMLLATVAIMMLGMDVRLDLLPLSDRERARRARRAALDRRYPSRRNRGYFWTGLGLAFGLWIGYSDGRSPAWAFALPALLMLIGAVSIAVWRFRHGGDAVMLDAA
ncbi:MAG: hypothetical protein HOQ32_19360 [Lysobacter sp.]|nr:hypothetical protein [Lysobacter sp.]